jgi:cytochrome c oxidase cbb3-type subunit 1
MTVNPKKLRPYDEPPRRRRRLIPDSPGSAAVGFLVAAVVWFAVATGLGVLAVGLRALPELAFGADLGAFGLTFELDPRRVDYAFLNATTYGWLSNAGLALLCFVTPRLFGSQLVGEKGLNLAVGIWNLAVLVGMATLYLIEIGPHEALTAFPWWIDGAMAFALLLVAGSFVATVGPDLRSAYVSGWYIAAALLAFLALTTANAALSFLELDAVLTALASAFLGRAVEVMWLLGMAVAALYYVVPLVAGVPLYSAGVAMLGWLTWLVLAPVSGLATLIDVSVPFWVTTLGSTATILLLVPASLVAVNLMLTLRNRLALLFGPSPVAFATVALTFLLATALLQAIGALRSVHLVVGGTDWVSGAAVFALLGTYTLAALAFAEHALPRMVRRAWGGGAWSAAILWTAFAGATIGGLALIGGGLAQGTLVADAADPEAVQQALLPYRATAALGLGLSALAGLAAMVNFFIAYTSAEPASYALPGASSAAAAGH